MRVITGSARGRKLESPVGNDTRPTTDKVKEAVYSAIQFEVEGANVLDLFAGSGQMGIEALSRGAYKATFVDSKNNCCELIKRNLKTTDLTKNFIVTAMDALTFCQNNNELYDLVFADPPYGKINITDILSPLNQKVRAGGAVIFESSIDTDIPETFGDFYLKKQYKYGKIKVSLYRVSEKE